MRFYLAIIILPFLLMFTSGCEPSDKRPSEGVIKYNVTYPKMADDNFMKDFMPDEMSMTFMEDKYKTELSAGMGMFQTNFVCNAEEETLAHLVKLINKKYALVLSQDEITDYNNETPKYIITKTKEKKEIAGLMCKKAIVKTHENDTEQFSIYYTDEIKVDLPNWCTKFKEIDGVLMEYQQEKYDICMRFTATNVNKKEIDESEFEIDENYERVSREKMDKEMKEIFESFSQ